MTSKSHAFITAFLMRGRMHVCSGTGKVFTEAALQKKWLLEPTVISAAPFSTWH